MKRWAKRSVVLMAMTLAVVSGCEWEMSDDGEYWNNRVAWVNFSGVYRHSTGVVVTPTPGDDDGGMIPPGGGGLAEIRNEVVGVGNTVDRTFSGTLAGRPVYPRTLTITDGTESFEDADGDGIFEGDKGGTGSVNYNTGVFTVTFLLPPAAGVNVRATYIYWVGEDGEVEPDPTPTDPDAPAVKVIRRLTVVQDGNMLFMTDADGDEYRGQMGRVSTSGGDMTGSTSGHVVANFEVRGGGIRIVGAFEGAYTAPDAEEGRAHGVMVDRWLRGTWFNAAGDKGNLDFAGAR